MTAVGAGLRRNRTPTPHTWVITKNTRKNNALKKSELKYERGSVEGQKERKTDIQNVKRRIRQSKTYSKERKNKRKNESEQKEQRKQM